MAVYRRDIKSFHYFFILFLLITLGCTKDTNPPLRIGIHFWPGLEFMQIAKDRLFFQSEEANIELVRFTSLADEQRAYENGTIDGAYVSLDQIIILNDRNIPATLILVGDISKGGDGIIARNHIKKLTDLAGAKIGVTIGATNHFTLIKALQQANMTEKDVQVINLSENSIMDAFEKGTIDVAVTWEPELSRYKNREDAHILFSSAEFPDLIIDGVVFPPHLLETRKMAISAMIRAWNKALEFAQMNPEDAFKDIALYEKSDANTMSMIFNGIEKGTTAVNKRVLGEKGESGTGVEAAKQVSEFLLKFGLISKPPEFTKLFNSSFVE